MALPRSIRDISIDPTSPDFAPIPASVIALSFARVLDFDSRLLGRDWQWTVQYRAAVGAQLHSQESGDRDPCWRLPALLSSSQLTGEEGNGWQLTLWVNVRVDPYCPVPWIPAPIGDLNCPLPSGLLPSGLRLLRFNSAYDRALQPGSLPSTLTFLELGL